MRPKVEKLWLLVKEMMASLFLATRTHHDGDFFGGEVVELVDEVIDLRFEGLDVGGGIGLLGGEDAVDERFDFLLLRISELIQQHMFLRIPQRLWYAIFRFDLE